MSGKPKEPCLLIVWHSRTGASEAMARAAALGAGSVALLVAAADVVPEMLLSADGFIFCCPENLGSMSGRMKEMFDRAYYPALGSIEGLPYGTLIAAGSDGQGAQRQIDRIVTGWRLRRVIEPLIANFDAQSREAIEAEKQVPRELLEQCQNIGAAMAEGLRLGMF